MSEPIHQEVVVQASAQRIYQTLIDARQFSAFTGAPAEISPEAGGAFSMFGGMISGRNIELMSGQRVVQAWRAGNWAEGIYSIVRFELKTVGADTLLVLDQTGFPAEAREDLEKGWPKMYWEPMIKYLA